MTRQMRHGHGSLIEQSSYISPQCLVINIIGSGVARAFLGGREGQNEEENEQSLREKNEKKKLIEI